MAKKTTTTVTDDMDGSADAQSVTFGLNGVAYSIDLGPKNAARLEKALEPFIEKASRQRGTATQAGTKPSAERDYDIAQLREWAGRNKIQLSQRGRIPGAVITQYKTAGGR